MACQSFRVVAPVFALQCFAGAARLAFAGDCNANGIEDADDITTGTSLDCNVSGLPDECELSPSPILFPEPEDHACGQSPVVRSADLNLDGVPDLVTANTSEMGMTVFMGTGDGSFGPGRTFGQFRALCLVLEDFDGDRRVDMVAFWQQILFFPGNGDGTFATFQMFSTGTLSICHEWGYPLNRRLLSTGGSPEGAPGSAGARASAVAWAALSAAAGWR